VRDFSDFGPGVRGMQKETVLQVVESMSEEIDLDELLNRLYVLQQIEEGERSLANEGSVSHEDVKKRFGL
jgi:hypothetical protein